MALALLKHFCAAAASASAAAASTAAATAASAAAAAAAVAAAAVCVHVFNPHQPKYVMTGGDGCVPEGTNCMTS